MASNLSFAQEALAVLADEAVVHYREIARRLARVPGRLVVDSERLLVTSDSVTIQIASDESESRVAIEVKVAAADVVRMIDGTSMMETLLANDRLFIRGDEGTLLKIAEAVSIFLDGTLKRRAFAALFERYRTWVDGG